MNEHFYIDSSFCVLWEYLPYKQHFVGGKKEGLAFISTFQVTSIGKLTLEFKEW